MPFAAPAVALTRRKPRPRRAALTTPLISVVIVNYCRWAETAALVNQLLSRQAIYQDRLEIIVVDNLSPSRVGAEAVACDPRVRFRQMDENVGFGAGVNEGVRLSQSPWVLVLNPDVILCPGFVDRLCAAALDVAEDASHGMPIGIVGFGQRNRDGSRQLSVGRFPSLVRMIAGLLRPRRVRKYIAPTDAQRQRVPWVTGSCMLLRRECLEALGGFDEDYFLYYEDVDVCRRATAEGYAVCFDPAVEAVHLDPLQSRELTATMRAVTRHASLVYFSKHLPGWPTWALAQLIRLETLLKGTLARFRGRRQEVFIADQLLACCDDIVAGSLARARGRLDLVLSQAGMRSA